MAAALTWVLAGVAVRRARADAAEAHPFAAVAGMGARIGEEGEVSQNRLGRLAAMDVATIKGVADRLRQKGLVVARPDPDDKRRMLLSLSEDGRALLDGMIAKARVITEETLAPLAPRERAVLLRLLRKLT